MDKIKHASVTSEAFCKHLMNEGFDCESRMPLFTLTARKEYILKMDLSMHAIRQHKHDNVIDKIKNCIACPSQSV